MKPTEKQVKSLPKWAQNLLRMQAEELARANAQLALLDYPETTPLSWRDIMAIPGSRHGLDPKSVIEFVFTRDPTGYRHEWLDAAFSYTYGGDYVDISGSGQLRVIPLASNRILICLDDRRGGVR